MDDARASRYRVAEAGLWREEAAQPRERWVDVAGHDIRVRVLEVGEGPPILFVHGITTAGSLWASLVARLPSRRCLILDRPGCGLSQPLPTHRVASFPALVDVQVAVLDSLGVESADVVGSSFGGACVLSLAEAMPDRVRRIVLVGAPLVAGARPPLLLRLLAAGPVARYLARGRVSARGIGWSARQFGQQKLLASGWPSGLMLDWVLSVANDTDTRRNDALVLQAIATWRGFRAARLFHPTRLSRIHQPALWLWGSDDPIATVDQGRAWAAGMPDATFEVFEAGHAPWLEEPGLHALRIQTFLDAGPRLQ